MKLIFSLWIRVNLWKNQQGPTDPVTSSDNDDDMSESSGYSDWMAEEGVNLEPPKRSKRRQVQLSISDPDDDDDDDDDEDDDDDDEEEDDDEDEDEEIEGRAGGSKRLERTKRRRRRPPREVNADKHNERDKDKVN